MTLQDRKIAVLELSRVLLTGGTVILLDLAGHGTTTLYTEILRKLGWTDVKKQFAGMRCIFGVWYCQIIIARKPIKV